MTPEDEEQLRMLVRLDHQVRVAERERLGRCAGKEGIASYELARDAARRVSRGNDAKAGTYRCRECGLWHVGAPMRPGSGRRPHSAKPVRLY